MSGSRDLVAPPDMDVTLTATRNGKSLGEASGAADANVQLAHNVTLLARGLERHIGEDDIRRAFESCGSVGSIKVLEKRRLAFVEFAVPEGLQAALAQGPNFEQYGLRCFVEASTHDSVFKTDERQAGKHVCAVCGRGFSSRSKLTAHMTDKFSHARAREFGAWESIDDLDAFDLKPNVMVADLSDEHRLMLRSYMSQAMSGSPELADILDSLVQTCPVAVRSKELFESIEAAKVVGQHVYDLSLERKVTDIFDLACGHALVGVLLAYRFPLLNVTCVDLEERPVWKQLLTCWRQHGKPPRSGGEPLQNIKFVCGTIDEVCLNASSVAIAVHACNEANQQVLEMCTAAGAGYAVIPCCIPERLYSGGHMSIAHLSDEARYAVMIGVVACQYKASRVTNIDRRITNRNIIVLGRSLTV
eukprot:TRINITY_DN90278_c0_g1_i1.p1 TRINITY_DN90278_c0_g1~~TRINITY_DN90278_c0_g1_i1.p1  ORF type:complete len:417 (+),score=29.94 TRINITY_DN90278_c0_g1_i1:154-1404(+)